MSFSPEDPNNRAQMRTEYALGNYMDISSLCLTYGLSPMIAMRIIAALRNGGIALYDSPSFRLGQAAVVEFYWLIDRLNEEANLNKQDHYFTAFEKIYPSLFAQGLRQAKIPEQKFIDNDSFEAWKEVLIAWNGSVNNMLRGVQSILE